MLKTLANAHDFNPNKWLKKYINTSFELEIQY